MAKSILTVGIAYGIIAFMIGLAGSFTLNSRDFTESLVGMVFGFLIVLPITITAIWKPNASAILLLMCFAVVECSGFANDGLRGVVLVAKKLALPNVALACGYIYVASSRLHDLARRN